MTSLPSRVEKRRRERAHDAAKPTDDDLAQEKKQLSQWIRMGEGGRIVIPAEMREALAISPGAKLLLKMHDGSLTVTTFDGAIKQLQDLARPYLEGKPSMVDELIAERRWEAEQE